ncbi:hypothetical protein E2542_SST10113 [Spatholobus suberectus]|nr:hypothetical protein E2542_SST10113 [Spatholobus suberectus]
MLIILSFFIFLEQIYRNNTPILSIAPSEANNHHDLASGSLHSSTTSYSPPVLGLLVGPPKPPWAQIIHSNAIVLSARIEPKRTPNPIEKS